MSNNTIQKIFLAGAGQMGQGIAQVAACSGLQVLLYDVSETSLSSAFERMRWSLEKLESKGRISEPPDIILSRVSVTTDLSSVADVDLVIEAVPEIESLKCSLFAQLDVLASPETIFTSNTSAIPISTLAAATRRAQRFCGLHFFNPVPMMPLVEVVRGTETSDSTIEQVTAFAEQIGKQPVQVKRDQAGFIVNRILGAAIIEAVRVLESGQASAADIDKAMRLGCGWKMGPLETADLAGLDVVVQMCDVMQRGNSDQVFASPALLRDHLAQGNFGRKSGRGIHDYTKSSD